MFPSIFYVLIHCNKNPVSFLSFIVQIRLLNQKQAVINGIAEKNPGKGFGNHTPDTQGLYHLRRLFPGRTASEILSRHKNISLSHLCGQIRTQRRKSILLHILNRLQRKVLCRDNNICINIIPHYPHLSFKLLHHCSSHHLSDLPVS